MNVSRLTGGILITMVLVGHRDGTAQQGLRFGLTGTVSLYETNYGPEGETHMSGPVAGSEGAIGWGPVLLRAGYAEGWLDNVDGFEFNRNFVEGYVYLGGSPVRGLEILVGPHARSFSSDAFARPTWYGEMHVRYEAPIVPRYLGATFEGWGAFVGETAERDQLSNLRGGAVGVAVRPTGGRLMLRLSYAIDQARFDVRPRRRALDAFSLTFGYALH